VLAPAVPMILSLSPLRERELSDPRCDRGSEVGEGARAERAACLYPSPGSVSRCSTSPPSPARGEGLSLRSSGFWLPWAFVVTAEALGAKCRASKGDGSGVPAASFEGPSRPPQDDRELAGREKSLGISAR
jgi:hypothetical protein